MVWKGREWEGVGERRKEEGERVFREKNENERESEREREGERET